MKLKRFFTGRGLLGLVFLFSFNLFPISVKNTSSNLQNQSYGLQNNQQK